MPRGKKRASSSRGRKKSEQTNMDIKRGKSEEKGWFGNSAGEESYKE